LDWKIVKTPEGIIVPTEWIAVDWGMTHLRAWTIGADGLVLKAFDSNDGVGTLSPDEFEAAILSLVGDSLDPAVCTTFIACGMVGAQQGWAEASYSAVPGAPLVVKKMTRAPTTDPRLTFWIIPGMKQNSPADVMRGEETQIAGFLLSRPDFDGVICLPGTHSKWALVQNGTISRFQTFMTGELFALLAKQSVLRQCVDTDGFSGAEFRAAVEKSYQAPVGLTSTLFSLRGEALLHGVEPEIVRARLSRMLVGNELAAARHYCQSGEIVIIGAAANANLYAMALKVIGLHANIADVEEMTIAGLYSAYQEVGEIHP
jgi:2-dehydro-3-deoxygalactonokinase